MNGAPRGESDGDGGDPGRRRDEIDPDRPDEGADDPAMPLPATSDDERHAAEPIESDESIAGEEDPGAALDEGAGDGAGRGRSER